MNLPDRDIEFGRDMDRDVLFFVFGLAVGVILASGMLVL